MTKTYKFHEIANIFPLLQGKELQDLTTDITTNGLKEPIVLYENQILDGRNRYQACISGGVEPKFITYTGSNALSHVISLNLHRRHLNESQRGLVADKLAKKEEGRPTKNSLNLDCYSLQDAADLLNVSRATVANARKVRIEAPESVKEIESGKKTINEVKKDLKEKVKKEKRQKLINQAKKMSLPERVQLKQGDCLILSKELKDNSIDLIVTDPPYPIEFIDCWTKLGKIAMRVLKPSGFCIAYSGQINLPEVLNRVTKEGLLYYWQFIVLHTGRAAACQGRKIDVSYKPILVFQKPPFKQLSNYCSDLVKGSGREKDGHDWQQGEEELKQIFDIFYDGGTVLEPFAGSGTTLAYCKKKQHPVIGYELDNDTYKIALARVGDIV